MIEVNIFTHIISRYDMWIVAQISSKLSRVAMVSDYITIHIIIQFMRSISQQLNEMAFILLSSGHFKEINTRGCCYSAGIVQAIRLPLSG